MQEGESLTVQAEACKKIAHSKGWKIVHEPWFESFSGRKDDRPVFNEILQFLDRNPGLVKYYVFRSIDRFTRRGAYAYETMKQELSRRGVLMMDSYGVIQESRNTLEEFGLEYEWSKFSPSEFQETFSATTAKNEITTILTRMISQSIRNTRQGYRTRRPADGYLNKKVYVDGKKKVIQVPDPERARFKVAIYELTVQGLSDPEIVERINATGYHSPITHRWSTDRTKIIGKRGGSSYTVKQLQRDRQNTIYAGVVCEKWTAYMPVRAQYEGLVSIELWNAANRGKLEISANEDGSLNLIQGGKTGTKSIRSKHNPLFPYKFIRCHFCKKPMLGSSPRGKLGIHRPFYHCARGHKYWGLNKQKFDEAVEDYIKNLKFNSDVLSALEITFLNKYRQREKEIVRASGEIHRSISDLEVEQAAKLDAIVLTKSDTVRSKLEREIEALEEKIKSAGKERIKIHITRGDIKSFIRQTKYVMEHPAEILLNTSNPRLQEALFGLIFQEVPTYEEIVNGTPKLSYIFELSSDFSAKDNQLVTLRGIEPRLQE
ncbi:MAG: hypothetical protein RL538_629 [Candidatus Parcubacteria bacterium]